MKKDLKKALRIIEKELDRFVEEVKEEFRNLSEEEKEQPPEFFTDGQVYRGYRFFKVTGTDLWGIIKLNAGGTPCENPIVPMKPGSGNNWDPLWSNCDTRIDLRFVRNEWGLFQE
jgi:hypothetical protein